MDKASDYESGDSRFESWRGRLFFLKEKKEIGSQIIKEDDLKSGAKIDRSNEKEPIYKGLFFLIVVENFCSLKLSLLSGDGYPSCW